MPASTKPVDLLSRIHKDGFTMSPFALFDVLLIALMFTLLSSKFILAPGFGIDLGQTINLPRAEAGSLQGEFADDDVTVLNLRGRGMIIFEGRIYNEDAFARFMQTYRPKGPVLLLKADAGMNSQTLLNICALAEKAGFKRVQVAAYSDY